MHSKLFLLLLLPLSPLQAQTPIEIPPQLERSMGNRNHTSRDELIQMSQDQDGNLLLLGFVEGDSIFADVSLQKISPEGNLLWDYRFDSKNSNNYDVPLKMAVDASGNAIVLGLSYGIVSFFTPQYSNGYLLKIAPNGQLLWQVGFDTLLPPHESGLHCDGFLDTLGNFNVTYSLYVEFGDRPTYFLKFDPDGQVIQSFTKYDIAQAFGGGSFASGQAVDSTGNFIFIHFEDPSVQPTAIRKVNAETGAEDFAQFNFSGLSSTEIDNFGYMPWLQTWVNEYGEIYSANNTEPPFASAFFLSKANAFGGINYVIKPDSMYIHFASLETWRGFVYITGSYVPTNGTNSVAFVWKINGEGMREYEIVASAAHDCVPRFLDIEQGNLYWAVADVVTGAVTVKELNAGNLAVQWEYKLHQDQSYRFTGTKVTKLSNGLYAFGGTLRKEKLPGSPYLSEEEFYVETFLATPNELYGQYQMTESGTTHTESILFSIDQNGNKWAKTVEFVGPGYNVHYISHKYYYHKYSKNLEHLWSMEIQGQSYSSYGFPTFSFDNIGNAYVLEYEGQDTLLLKKISPDGVYLNSYRIIGASVYQIFIDRQNRIHLSLSTGNGIQTSIVLSPDFLPIQTPITGLYPIVKFQLPSDDAVYYYMEDLGTDIGEHDIRILLFKDGQQVWERAFSFSSTPDPFSRFSVDITSGALLGFSRWFIASGFETALHRFAIDNTYSKTIINNGVNENIYDATLLPNGNVYVAFQTRLELYDPASTLVSSIPINDAPSGGYFFSSGNVFYRAHYGTLEAFSDQGLPLLSVKNAAFSIDPAQISIDKNGIATTGSIYGELMGAGSAFGWRWLRSKISAFDLSPYLTTNAVELSPIKHKSVTCHPNPAAHSLQVDLGGFAGKNVRLSITSALGVPGLERVYEPLLQPIVNLDVRQLPVGQYFLTVYAEGSVVSTKIWILR